MRYLDRQIDRQIERKIEIDRDILGGERCIGEKQSQEERQELQGQGIIHIFKYCGHGGHSMLLTLKEMPKRWRGEIRCEENWRKNITDRRVSKCKGPKMEGHLAYSKNSKKVGMNGVA